MMPGMNKKMLEQAMKKMGIKQVEIPATEVIIKTPDKDLIIRNPQVSRVNAMGQESIQVIGDIEEVSSAISAEDIKTVAKQANASEEKAKEALEKHHGDLAAAILELTNE